MWNPFRRAAAPAVQLSETFRQAREYADRNHELRRENVALSAALAEAQAVKAKEESLAREFIGELVEAQAMCGAGPWAPGDPEAYARRCKPIQEALQLKEGGPVGDISPLGAYGLYELLLQNVNWQREINYSWMEFSRWGIQQIILICRLYYVKNPIVRRLVDVCAQYVFARGFDATTDDEDANKIIQDFFARNQKVLGHVALMELEKSKDRDGNLFFCLFSDKGTGQTDIRLIDATEMQEIRCDPNDSDIPQYYHRIWTQRTQSGINGEAATQTQHAWYPALNFEPPAGERPAQINNYPVMWDQPVFHYKVGAVGKWLFGCPRIYPMLDWAKEARRFLEACASVRQSLSQFAFSVSTRGGQQAIEGIKQNMQTQIGPGAPVWDTNPPAVAGATWISGPGTTLEAFKVQGSTFSPDDVRWYVIMCCMTKGLPPTFLGDMQTSNLATATSLDRPTETVFLSLQEEWVECLVVLLKYVLQKSLRTPGGKLRAACVRAGANPGEIVIREAAKVRLPSGRWKYVEAKKQMGNAIEIRVNFPSIREGDIPQLITATVSAMTLGNKGGQIVGIDEKEGVKHLYRQLDIEHGDEIVESQYPEKDYDPNRLVEDEPPPVPTSAPQPGPQPTPAQAPAAAVLPKSTAPYTPLDQVKPAAKAAESLRRLADAMEARNGS